MILKSGVRIPVDSNFLWRIISTRNDFTHEWLSILKSLEYINFWFKYERKGQVFESRSKYYFFFTFFLFSWCMKLSVFCEYIFLLSGGLRVSSKCMIRAIGSCPRGKLKIILNTHAPKTGSPAPTKKRQTHQYHQLIRIHW